MKTQNALVVAVLSGLVWMPISLRAQAKPGNAFAGNVMTASLEADPALSDAPDRSLYEEGTRAINEGRWSDAVSIFIRVADQRSVHAEGALYWKAYAENKQGLTSQALDTCAELRRQYAGSSWIEECGALEIEIRGKSGHPVQPKPDQSDDLKLLSLNTLMQHDEKKALAEIEQILNSDSSEKLKQGALFILSEHRSDTIYNQIARVSYVEGDVRVARGEENKKSKDTTWEKAAADLPLEAGFSLVTGEGRAEIELENASTLYLGENSVLTFNDLHTMSGIPHTEVALLSGTVTLHIHPYVEGEVFVLRTPTDTMATKYPQFTHLRVSSYVDGMAITPLGMGNLGVVGAASLHMTPGQTIYFKEGKHIMDAGPIHPPDFTAWDQWVAARYEQRSSAQAALMKESGLNSPVPGLAQMQGQGTFFKCEPYGTCWEPKVPTEIETGENASPQSRPESNGQALTSQSQNAPGQTTASGRNIQFVGKPMPNSTVNSPSELYALLPCFPWEIRSSYGMNTYYPWEWAACHSGSWIYHQNRYVWVVGRRHHHPPIHWVKYGKTVGFVPVHPHDIKDRPPVNGRNGVFAVNTKDLHPIARIPVEPSHRVEVLREPPKSFRDIPMPLARAGVPRLEAHQVKDSVVAKGTPIKQAGIPMTFNHKTQSFMLPRQVTQGNHTVTLMAPMSNHDGSLQAHAGGFSGGGGHGYVGGGGGGASHSGGGGASGGGSHSSGSSSSGASSSSASSATSSAGSSSGGSHR